MPTKPQDFTARATVASDARIPFVHDPTGTPGDSYITGANLEAQMGGASAVLQSESPSDVASVDLTLSGSHRTYIIDGWIVPATDSDDVRLRCDVGSGFDSGNNYGWAARMVRSDTTLGTANGGNTDTSIDVGGFGMDNGTNGGISFRIIIQRAKVARYTDFIIDVTSINPTNAELRNRIMVGGWHLEDSSVDAVRLFCPGGNIAAGQIDLKVG